MAVGRENTPPEAGSFLVGGVSWRPLGFQVKLIGRNVLDATVQTLNVTAFLAVERTDSLSPDGIGYRGGGIIGRVVKIILPGGARSQGIFVRLPKEVAGRAPDGACFGGLIRRRGPKTC